jgi:hypothetical protein
MGGINSNMNINLYEILNKHPDDLNVEELKYLSNPWNKDELNIYMEKWEVVVKSRRKIDEKIKQ